MGGADLRVCFSHLLGPHPLCSEKYDGEGEAGGLVVCGCMCVCVCVCVYERGEGARKRSQALGDLQHDLGGLVRKKLDNGRRID